MIIVTALRTHAAATKTEELVAGRVGMEAAFHFSPEWDGLGKTAVFEAGGVAKDVIVGDDPCIVPHECMIEGAELRVGIYGMSADGTIVIPTVYALVGTVKKGADPSGDESYPPTPDVGEQAVAAASKALQAAASAQEVAAEIQRRADAGEFDGKDGDDYVLTEADKVEIAEIAADLVDVPEGGGSADLTGYAKEEWVKAGYQPKGDYATKSEIPTVPTKLSAFTNDAGFVTEDALEDLGGKAYVQNTQPANMKEGEFWYNPDEESEGNVPSGGGEEWRIIKTVKLTADVQNIIIDTDNDGNPFSLKKFIIWGWTQGTASGGQLRINAAVRTDSANSYFGSWITNFRGLDTTKRYWRFECSRGPVVGDHTKWYAEYAAPDSGTTMQALGATNWYHTPEDDNGNNILAATFINILSNTSTVQFTAGSEIELWGVDA